MGFLFETVCESSLSRRHRISSALFGRSGSGHESSEGLPAGPSEIKVDVRAALAFSFSGVEGACCFCFAGLGCWAVVTGARSWGSWAGSCSCIVGSGDLAVGEMLHGRAKTPGALGPLLGLLSRPGPRADSGIMGTGAPGRGG
jgi:hypothetical protein